MDVRINPEAFSVDELDWSIFCGMQMRQKARRCARVHANLDIYRWGKCKWRGKAKVLFEWK
jgi:hypothetical protein